MVTYKHNEPYYKLKIDKIDEDKLRILSFEGEEVISDLFSYKLELLSDDPEIDTSQILNKKASFEITRGDEDSIFIHGIISQFEQRGKSPDYVSYFAVLVPKLWRLNLTFRNEVYQNMNIEDLVSNVLKDSGFSGSDFKFDLTGSYPVMEYIVQYRETNLNFIKRKLEHYGIFFYFDHSGDNDVVVFTDSNDKLKKINKSEDILYSKKDPFSETETIGELTCSESIVTGAVKLKDYNYMFPEKQLIGESNINSDFPGVYYDYGDNFQDENEAEELAKVRNQEILAQSKIFYGTSDCRLFSAGKTIKVGKHYRESWNSDYILVKVISSGSQRGLFGILPPSKKITTSYENQFKAIPIDIDYRPPRKTPIPKVSGIMSAKIESAAGDEYAYMDDQGRYKAKMLFDLSDSSNGEASLPIRLSQSYSGAGYGMHFPNHENTELVWACVDGNVDRPIGLSTVPNPSNSAPTTGNNKTQNIIRTASGNEIIMDDKTDEAQIGITTPDANKILFDDKDDKIEVMTKDKHKFTLDDKNQKINVKSKDGHKILMDDKNTKIEVVSKNEHFITINDKGGEEKIQLSDKDKKNTFIIDIQNQQLVIKTTEGSIDILAPNGAINIKSSTLNIETEGDTNIKADNLKAEAQTDYKMKAMSITEEASTDLKLSGMNAEIKGDMEFKAEGGMNAELKGGVGLKLSGE
jgi:type VI secretion system secreted protein VgrG